MQPVRNLPSWGEKSLIYSLLSNDGHLSATAVVACSVSAYRHDAPWIESLSDKPPSIPGSPYVRTVGLIRHKQHHIANNSCSYGSVGVCSPGERFDVSSGRDIPNTGVSGVTVNGSFSSLRSRRANELVEIQQANKLDY